VDAEGPDGGWAGRGLAEIVFRHWLLIVLSVLAVTGLAYGLSSLQPTRYRAEARLLLNDPRSSSVFSGENQTVLDPARYVRNRAEYITSEAVLTRASDRLQHKVDVPTLRQRVTATPEQELDLVTISALDPTPEGAAQTANAVAKAYQDVVKKQVTQSAEQTSSQLKIAQSRLQRRIDSLDSQLRGQAQSPVLAAQREAAATQLLSTQSQADQVSVDAALYGSGVALFEQAKTPVGRAQPKPLGAAAIGSFFGLLLGLALAWWRSERRSKVEDRQDPAAILGAPLLGEVPLFHSVGVDGSMPADLAPKSVVGEAYHFIISALSFAFDDIAGHTLVVTSAGPGDGKTVTAVNLGIAAVGDGRRVVVVDADERARGLTALTGVPAEPGLTDLAGGDTPPSMCANPITLHDDSQLTVVPAGRRLADPAGFFRTGQFRAAMKVVKGMGDLVIVDSPPLLAVSDASAITSQADGMIIVVSRGTPVRMLKEMRQRLNFIGTPLLGYVFTKAQVKRSRGGYGYGYGRYGASYGERSSKPNRLGRRSKTRETAGAGR